MKSKTTLSQSILSLALKLVFFLEIKPSNSEEVPFSKISFASFKVITLPHNVIGILNLQFL